MFQCHLDAHGASNLVVDLIMNNANHKVFLETVELGIALLEGGNGVIQVGSILGTLIPYTMIFEFHEPNNCLYYQKYMLLNCGINSL